MLVRDVMSANPVTVNSSATLAEMRRVMDERRIKRLPVLDEGKLVGIVTHNALDREMSSLISTLTASEVMVRHLVTVSPDATVEEGVALAQAKKVGALLVVQHSRLVGIATTNDFFYKILNPLLGIDLPGSRVAVSNCRTAVDVENVLHIINLLDVDVTGMFTMKDPKGNGIKLTAHLAIDDPGAVVTALEKQGYGVETRKR